MDIDTIESELRNKADCCHNNQSSKTFEDWERMAEFLLEAADVVKTMNWKNAKADVERGLHVVVSGWDGMSAGVVDTASW